MTHLVNWCILKKDKRFVVKLCLSLFVTMWWQQNTCVVWWFFLSPSLILLGGEWTAISVHVSLCQFFLILTNPVWKSKRTQKLWNASSVWGAGSFSESRWAVTQLADLDGFLPPPGSGLDSVLMSWVFIQVVIFGLVLDVKGDICTYYTYRR